MLVALSTSFSATPIALRPAPEMTRLNGRPSASRRHTGMPGFAFTSRISLRAINALATLIAAPPFNFSVRLAAPSLRCAACESTPSWPSDKLRIFILHLITTACAATDQTPQSARRQRGRRGGHVDIPKICPTRRGA